MLLRTATLETSVSAKAEKLEQGVQAKFAPPPTPNHPASRDPSRASRFGEKCRWRAHTGATSKRTQQPAGIPAPLIPSTSILPICSPHLSLPRPLSSGIPTRVRHRWLRGPALVLHKSRCFPDSLAVACRWCWGCYSTHHFCLLVGDCSQRTSVQCEHAQRPRPGVQSVWRSCRGYFRKFRPRGKAAVGVGDSFCRRFQRYLKCLFLTEATGRPSRQGVASSMRDMPITTGKATNVQSPQ